MATSYRTLELNVISGKQLRDVHFISKMNVYAVVTISGDHTIKKQKFKTHIDRSGGSNPSWNFPIKFTINESLAQQNRLILYFKIKSEGLLGDKTVGEVIVPFKQLWDSSGDPKLIKFLSYQVRSRSGKPKGELHFSYKFSEPATGKTHNETVTAYPEKTHAKDDEPVTAYPATMTGSSSSPYGYPPSSQAGYGYPPPPQTGYGYPTAQGHATAAAVPYAAYPQHPHKAGHGYPQQHLQQQQGYGYPPAPQPGYGYPPQQGYGHPPLKPPKKSGGGMGFGTGLLGGMLGGLLIGDMVSDAADYDGGDYGGGDFDGGFDF